MAFDIKQWLHIVGLVAALIPTPLAPFIAAGIQVAEQIPGATGKQKLAIAKQIVSIGAQATNAQAGKQVIDVATLNAAVESGVATVVAATNLIHPKTQS